MATDSNNGSTEETSGQEQQDQQQGTPGEKPGTETQTLVIDDNTKLPDTHPLVKSLGTLRAELATGKTELQEARAQAARVTQLETELAARPTPEAVTTLQKRSDRLEAFLSAVGGPLSRALDSRTFTKDLFESEKDVKDIVKDYLRANPTATSQALGGGNQPTGGGKQDPNDLIRAAFNGTKN